MIGTRLMGALGGLISVSLWFFQAITSPFSDLLLTTVPAIATLSLVGGVFWAIYRRDVRVTLFLLPIGFSEIMAGIAGAFRGSMVDSSPSWALLSFLALEMVLIGYLIARLRGARMLALLFAVFCVVFAFWTAFIAAMSLTDDWI